MARTPRARCGPPCPDAGAGGAGLGVRAGSCGTPPHGPPPTVGTVAEEDFTIVLVMGLPGPWPPPGRVRLLENAQPDGRQITLNGYPDGHLEAAVSTVPNAPPSAVMHFQKVHVTGPNLFTFALTYGSGRLQAWINGTELATLAASSGAVFTIPERKPPDGQTSYTHPDALAACQVAMDERADRFKTRKSFQPRVASRSKTSSQQREELGQAAQALLHLHDLASAGALHLVPALASQLRGLIYWPPRNRDSPNWNPLLLRLANADAAPLPIFAVRERPEDVPDIIKAANYRAENFAASCRRRYLKDDLMDVEDYLAMPVLLVRDSTGGSRIATVADILAATANSMGSAHYDETVPLYLDDFQAQVFLGRTLAHVLILGLAEVVADLSEHLLAGPRPSPVRSW